MLLWWKGRLIRWHWYVIQLRIACSVISNFSSILVFLYFRRLGATLCLSHCFYNLQVKSIMIDWTRMLQKYAWHVDHAIHVFVSSTLALVGDIRHELLPWWHEITATFSYIFGWLRWFVFPFCCSYIQYYTYIYYTYIYILYIYIIYYTHIYIYILSKEVGKQYFRVTDK